MATGLRVLWKAPSASAWGADIRSWEGLNLPPEGAKAVGLTDKELSMAKQLVDDMTSKWKPENFRDSFKDEIMALVDKKVKAGKTETVLQPEEAEPGRSSAQIIDLTELLQRSLRKGDTGKTPAKVKARAKPAVKAPARAVAKAAGTRRRAA